MNGMTTTIYFFVLWVGMVSGCTGCVIGMLLMVWRQRRVNRSIDFTYSLQAEALLRQQEVETLLCSLVEINSQVDARVGQHSNRVDKITQSLEAESRDLREPLIRAAKLLVTANQRLQTDLVTAQAELEHQRGLVNWFKEDSRTDSLTKLSNRRAFDIELEGFHAKFVRENIGFSLLFVDIDHFKGVNDNHGHPNGDRVLCTVAQCLKHNLQVQAFVSRYGGEEFAVILPGVSGRHAMKIAEHLRRNVERCTHHLEGTELNVTVSIGVAEILEGDTTAELIDRSDQALFAAKDAGRNHCCYHDWVKCMPQQEVDTVLS